MERATSIRVAALVARAAGLATIRGLRASALPFEFVGLFTHRRLPASEDPMRGERPEYGEYAELAREMGIPCYAVDDRSEPAQLDGLRHCRPFDLLLSVNWRYPISAECLTWACVASVNLHRGRLPEYAGAEPVRRALEAREKVITLTAHLMTPEIDAGPILVEHAHAVGDLRGRTLSDDVERIKREIAPFYPRLALEAIERVRVGAADPRRCVVIC